MPRSAILAAARSARMRSLIETMPVTRSVVGRFVAGSQTADAVRVASELMADGRRVTLDHLGEDTTDRARAHATVTAYRTVLTVLADAGVSAGCDVSVKLSAIGRQLPADGEKIALDNARAICATAAGAGATVTLDMEDHTTTDSTLAILRELRTDFPWVGAVLQAYLRRTEQDCRDLAGAGSRVRLCKGAYAEPASVVYRDRYDVDRSYLRCLGILMRGRGYPMVATHDPKIIKLARRLVADTGRDRTGYEFQMLYGVRPAEQRRIAARCDPLRVYVPYGVEWYGYFVRRLAERPANLAFFLRSLATKG
jgi:proline dehydrogenase